MLTSLGFGLRQGCQFLTLAILFKKKQYFKKELIKTKEISTNVKS
jgi:hypothetical protein